MKSWKNIYISIFQKEKRKDNINITDTIIINLVDLRRKCTGFPSLQKPTRSFHILHIFIKLCTRCK